MNTESATMRVYVDRNQIRPYTPDGSAALPYKTIAEALAGLRDASIDSAPTQIPTIIVLNGDYSSEPTLVIDRQVVIAADGIGSCLFPAIEIGSYCKICNATFPTLAMGAPTFAAIENCNNFVATITGSAALILKDCSGIVNLNNGSLLATNSTISLSITVDPADPDVGDADVKASADLRNCILDGLAFAQEDDATATLLLQNCNGTASFTVPAELITSMRHCYLPSIGGSVFQAVYSYWVD